MSRKKPRTTKRSSQAPLVTNVKPINLEDASIEDLCLMELLAEASENARTEGHEGHLTLSKDLFNAKIAEKKREKKETGKVSTFLTEE